MRKGRRDGYDAYKRYSEYGLSKYRVKALLKECRAGQHGSLLQEAARQARPEIAKWIVSSIAEGRSLDRMTLEWELGKAEIMPCGRNTFYAYRKLTLAILDNMLLRKEEI